MQQKRKEEQQNVPKGRFFLGGLFAAQVKVEEKFDAQVRRNPAVETIEMVFSALVKSKSFFTQLKKEVEKIRCSGSDIEEFILLLSKYQQEKNFANRAGIFLSELCNRCNDEKITLYFSHLETPINYVAYKNRKEIYVIGDVGNCAGQYMQGGSLTIEGCCGHMLGAYAEGGQITVKGNALDYAGMEMLKGNILIEGMARDKLGYRMKGGQIFVRQNVRDEVGLQMESGGIIVMGNARNDAGKEKRGGKIVIYGFAGEGANKGAKGEPAYILKNSASHRR
ncbi:MAG: hypothetical protein QXT25_04230 [Candidatus Anstonellaceae archaeon]